MANYCDYEIEIKGRKNACYAFYGSTPVMDYIKIENE